MESVAKQTRSSKVLLVTGSNGLIGSEMVHHFHKLGWKVHGTNDFTFIICSQSYVYCAFVLGMDNNMRADFFGPPGDTRWNQKRMEADFSDYEHHEVL
jgi:CDP-paratose 2-epimerase